MIDGTRFWMIDTETTGLPDDPDAHVIEVAAVYWEGDTVKAWYQASVCPPLLTAAGLNVALRISGITEEEIRAGKSPALVEHELTEWLDTHDAPATAWSAPFDTEMMRRTLPRVRPRWVQCAMEAYLDLMHSELGPWFDLRDKRIKLNTALERHGLVRTGQSHRALSDAMSAAQVFHLTLTRQIAPRPMPATGSVTQSTPPIPKTGVIVAQRSRR